MTDTALTTHPALVLKPGDRVLIECEAQNPEAFAEMKAQLEERFPDVEFTLIAGMRVAGVVRG